MGKTASRFLNKPSEEEPIPFAKMEGCGNDYVCIDSRSQAETLKKPFSKREIKNISDRNLGIGSDGLVLLGSSAKGEPSMSMWNADGSPSDMCGNALRCLALWEYQRTAKKVFRIQSPKFLHPVRILAKKEASWIEIGMPPPFFAAQDIPFDKKKAKQTQMEGLICADLKVDSELFALQKIYTLSMANPHCVLFIEEDDSDLQKFHVQELGKLLGTHPAFPEGCNVEFSVQKDKGLFIRTYERGSGETLACGSGACAAHVAAVITQGASACQKVFLRGGELEIEWQGSLQKEESVFMRGPARLVYTGNFMRSEFQY